MKKFLLIALLIPTISTAFPLRPDPSMTYPTYCQRSDADFKTIKYGNVAICNRSVSSSLKAEIYDAYNIPKNERKSYIIDHLVPLSMGGSNKITNLWPQHSEVSSTELEGDTYIDLENGLITHEEAVSIILNRKLQ